jgi:hypothetical protein
MTELVQTLIASEEAVTRIERKPSDAQTVGAILKERELANFDYTNTAKYIQRIKRVIWSSPNWPTMSDDQRETLEMLAHKMGRILSGDPNHADHWLDIAGYATLTAERVGQAQP